MGGQACILYGGAEFSRDIDFAVVSSAENLERGHAIHFRARHPEAEGFRIDVMSKLRGVDPFPRLWERRSTFELPGTGLVDVLSLPDLVAAKKTQRDKDWVMIRRLVEASYARDADSPNPEQVAFWLGELRSPEILIACARSYPEEAQEIARARPATAAALQESERGVEDALAEEEARERALDREYWRPLRAELEEVRRGRRSAE